MVRVEWSDEAVAHINEIVAYIERFDPVAADKLGARLFALGESLAHFPNRGRPAGRGRRELVTVPPYILRYVVIDDVVFVLSVRHGRRRPL